MKQNAREFAEVYDQSLPAVWHFVSSRIFDYQEAQDITSEVFTRAWQAWSRYDSARGSVTAWLCGIAQRAVADWWRRRRPVNVEWEAADTTSRTLAFDELLRDESAEPEEALLQNEFVARLRRALDELDVRERDAIALRFGAGLQALEIATILDLSLGATKMMLHRTIMKLRTALEAEPLLATPKEIELLDGAISDVLARHGSTLPDQFLNRVLMSLAVLHRMPIPAGLPNRVSACITCSAQQAQMKEKGTMRSLLARLGIGASPAIKAATIPACVLCGTGLLLVGPLTAVGLLIPAYIYHASLIVLAPLNYLLLWRSYRVHRQVPALVLGGIGVLLILTHMTMHLLSIGDLENGITSAAIFVQTLIWLGALLLSAAYVVDWRAKRQFVFLMRRQYAT